MNIPTKPSEVMDALRRGEAFGHNSMLSGSWRVIYKDGSELAQYDKEGREVPYKSIEWNKVNKLVLESQYTTQTFTINHPGDEYKLSLRSRHWLTMSGKRNMVFMLVCWDAKDNRPNDNNINWIIYWIPNGLIHHCSLFNCPDVVKYCSGMLHGEIDPLIPTHGSLTVDSDADIG